MKTVALSEIRNKGEGLLQEYSLLHSRQIV
jgi:hypothetical protein